MLNLFRSVFAPPRDLILPLVAAWLGMILAGKRAGRAAETAAALDALFAAMSIAFLAGGRLFFAAAHLPAFAQSPGSLLSLNVDLFDLWGGVACGCIAALTVMQRKRLAFWPTLDLLTPFLAILFVGVSLSNLASGAAFGSETHLPWAIELWGAPRHPTQIYEILAGTITLGVIWLQGSASRPGRRFLLLIALTAASRLIIEAFRGDSTLVFGGLRVAQILAWIALAAALAGLELLSPAQDTENAGLGVPRT